MQNFKYILTYFHLDTLKLHLYLFQLVEPLTPLIFQLPHTELTLVDGCEQKYTQTPSYLNRRDGRIRRDEGFF